MFVRYQTVRNVTLGAVGVGLVAWVAWPSGAPSPAPEPAAVAVRPSTPAAVQPLAGVPDAPRSRPGAALDDAAIIALGEGEATPNTKVKDAVPKSPVKVNLYEETGDASFDRLKVDANRDDVWDAQWVRKGGHWSREDGAVWVDGRWSGGGAPEVAAVAEVAEVGSPAAPAASPVEARLLVAAKAMLEQRATSRKTKDLFNGVGPKINMYDDDGDGRWDRAKVDFERDGTWDESWTVKGGVLERKVNATGAISVFANGAWVPKG